MVDQIFDNEKLLFTHLQKFQKAFRTSAPKAIAITKQIIAEIDKVEPSKQVNYLAKKFADCMLSEEAEEGILAFLQKRQPKWVTSNYD